MTSRTLVGLFPLWWQRLKTATSRSFSMLSSHMGYQCKQQRNDNSPACSLRWSNLPPLFKNNWFNLRCFHFTFLHYKDLENVIIAINTTACSLMHNYGFPVKMCYSSSIMKSPIAKFLRTNAVFQPRQQNLCCKDVCTQQQFTLAIWQENYTQPS